MPATATAISADNYRRAARRLRCRHAGNPARLQQSLKALATQTNTAPSRFTGHDDPLRRGTGFQPLRTVWTSTSPHNGELPHPSSSFADYVARSLPPTVLRYSQRIHLLAVARRHGISRFEANLIIAAMLHRRPRPEEDAPSEACGAMAWFAAFALVQSAVLLGAWWTLLR